MKVEPYPPRMSTAGVDARLSSFKIVKKLGEGSYAEVFQVIREVDGRMYALKETNLSSLSHPERMDAVNEIRLLVAITHPQIIRCHEAFLKSSKLCTVMELATSGDLKQCIRQQQEDLRSPFPEEMIWTVCLQICRGLQALHAKNVIHRDIKPANVFMCENKFLKIGDLGVAKTLMHDVFTSTQIGTPAYMAPEVWARAKYSYSSDLYSLGCILYEMMCYKLPFMARSMEAMKQAVCNSKFTPIPASSGYSEALREMANALISREPRKRPTPADILASPEAQKWGHVMPQVTGDGAFARQATLSELVHARSSGAVCATPVTGDMPRELRHLPKLLPEASYSLSDVSSDASPRDSDRSSDRDRGRDTRRGRDQGPPGPSHAGTGAAASRGMRASDQGQGGPSHAGAGAAALRGMRASDRYQGQGWSSHAGIATAASRGMRASDPGHGQGGPSSSGRRPPLPPGSTLRSGLVALPSGSGQPPGGAGALPYPPSGFVALPPGGGRGGGGGGGAGPLPLIGASPRATAGGKSALATRGSASHGGGGGGAFAGARMGGAFAGAAGARGGAMGGTFAPGRGGPGGAPSRMGTPGRALRAAPPRGPPPAALAAGRTAAGRRANPASLPSAGAPSGQGRRPADYYSCYVGTGGGSMGGRAGVVSAGIGPTNARAGPAYGCNAALGGTPEPRMRATAVKGLSQHQGGAGAGLVAPWDRP
ncbi:hypothetical protein FOA52_014634 [Chlamydomonas sp. UWO 241]|nr:hypothetical protein FOA52_014634 [Chlamydomonas sp. UWO 241]